MLGIYRITNKVNGKSYVGAALDIRRRWYTHKSKLRHGKHPSTKLANAWNKHGERNFEFEILEECTAEALIAREAYWIKHYNSVQSGMNILNFGSRLSKATIRRGFKHSEETKRLMSEAHKKKWAGIAKLPRKKKPPKPPKDWKKIGAKISATLMGHPYHGDTKGFEKWRRDAMNSAPTADCAECGSEFGQWIQAKKFCSLKCKRDWHNHRRPTTLSKRHAPLHGGDAQ